MSSDLEFRELRAPARRRVRPGRNEPCWCGSGTKYKRCHLDANDRAANESDDDDDDGAAGPVKLSAALLEIGGRMFDDLDDARGRRNLAQIVAAAWNLEILDRHGNVELAAGLRETLAASHDDGMLEVAIAEFIERKRERYPDDDRMIVRVEVVSAPTGLRLVVASAPPR